MMVALPIQAPYYILTTIIWHSPLCECQIREKNKKQTYKYYM